MSAEMGKGIVEWVVFCSYKNGETAKERPEGEKRKTKQKEYGRRSCIK